MLDRRALLLVLLLAAVPATPAEAAPLSWTVLWYVAADTDLEAFALVDLDEFADARAPHARVVALVDRAEGSEADGDGYSSADGDWTEPRLLELGPDGWVELERYEEMNLGDPATLSWFVNVGLRVHAPGSDRTALVLWDHGGAWSGFASDDSADGDGLTLAELDRGLADGLAAAGVDRLDLIGFDACLMATVEVADAVAPHARLLLASEELEPGDGWDYRAFGAALADGVDARELARRTIDSYLTHYREVEDDAFTTLSAIDLDAFPRLLIAMDGLRDAIVSEPEAVAFAFALAAEEASQFQWPGEDAKASVDFFQVVDRLTGADVLAVRDAALAVVALRDEVVVEAGHNSAFTGATGLAFFGAVEPAAHEAGYATYADVPFASRGWLDVVATLASTLGELDPDAPVIAPLEFNQASIAAGEEVVYGTTIEDENLASVALVLLSEGDDGTLWVEQTVPLFLEGSALDENGVYRSAWDVENVLDVAWDGVGLGLDNGEAVFLVPAEEAAPGSPFFEVYARVDRGTGRDVESALLRFDDRTGGLVSAWDLDRYVPLQLRRGDVVEVAWTGWDASGEFIEGFADPVPVRAAGLTLVPVDVPPGSYAVAVTARDLAGNVAVTDYVPLEIRERATESGLDEEAPPSREDSTAPTPPSREATPSEEVPLGGGVVAAAVAVAAALVRRRGA